MGGNKSGVHSARVGGYDVEGGEHDGDDGEGREEEDGEEGDDGGAEGVKSVVLPFRGHAPRAPSPQLLRCFGSCGGSSHLDVPPDNCDEFMTF